MKTARRRKAPPKVNGDAVEFLAKLSRADWQSSESVIGELADALPPGVLERIARKRGWTSCCSGTGFVLADLVRECGDIPCGECAL